MANCWIKAQNEDDQDAGSTPGDQDSSGTGLVAERTRPKLKKPPLYKVLLLNDDYTPMEFVVLLLMRFFALSRKRRSR